ncbi:MULTISPECIES: DUF6264 family protein [unclassified Mycolicibacterium]|uniref:DUF6264 family protein n=1 Tax=unclassified Mycolicibacterium TaxID=2636767 RepID=UPI002ED99E3F
MVHEDPELQEAISRYEQRYRSKPGRGHVALAVALLVLHAALVIETWLSWTRMAQTLEVCIADICGHPAGVDRTFWVAIPGSAALFIVDLGVTAYLMFRRRRAFLAPIAGCCAQLALFAVTALLLADAAPS